MIEEDAGADVPLLWRLLLITALAGGLWGLVASTLIAAKALIQ